MFFKENRELLQDFRNGDPKTLTKVFHNYIDLVANLVQHGFHSTTGKGCSVPGVVEPDLRREIVQTVFVKAFSEKARWRYDGERPYRPYLMQIARNALADHWRAVGRAEALESRLRDNHEFTNLSPGARQSKHESVEEQLTWRELQAETRVYMRTLSTELREFTSLRFEEEYSQPELARRLKVSRWRIRKMEKKVQDGLKLHLRRRGLLDSPFGGWHTAPNVRYSPDNTGAACPCH